MGRNVWGRPLRFRGLGYSTAYGPTIAPSEPVAENNFTPNPISKKE
jgi:hypothetical protein